MFYYTGENGQGCDGDDVDEEIDGSGEICGEFGCCPDGVTAATGKTRTL